ncbi:MAG TPA: hypothetical protein VM369_10955 [Candidatus Binatia bacterium]|nr:hypothetical protein [Candidatus Binatia bacterium]
MGTKPVWVGALAAAAFIVAGQFWLPQPCADEDDGARAVSRAGCLLRQHPEPAHALLQAQAGPYAHSGSVPAGAFRDAVAQKHALEDAGFKVAGAGGTWRPYGRGNLRVGGGYDNLAARADNFFYDGSHKRLFVAIGSGGIWMSETVGGDVRTLGDHWVSLGDALPTQLTGSVAWTPAGGDAEHGTLIAVSGEAVMASSGFLGLGGFWSDDLGGTWHPAEGLPDAALAFQAAVDAAHPETVYVATSKGLFRSADAGRTFANVRLPTHNEGLDCAGVETLGPCQFTNFVTDVVVKRPGGATSETCAAAGCPVLAVVGYRTGSDLAFQDGRPMAGDNGVYRSDTGEVNSFAKLDVSAPASAPAGFTPQERIGRIELGAAVGDDQDHNLVYAIVEDAVQFNDGVPYIDAPVDVPAVPVGLPVSANSSTFNGLYVSADFGSSWLRLADTAEIASNPASNSDLIVQAALGYAPGVQAWYNLWIKPDPTRTDEASAAPTRLTFGLEEVWQNVTAAPLTGPEQQGEADFEVIGAYGGQTHPDQQAGLYVPTGDGGVCLFAGNDGGVFRQCAAAGEDMDNTKWASANTGIYALLPYGIAVAKDGVIWWGLQDNGSGSTSTSGRSTMKFGGDGFYAAVDPDNSRIAYTEIDGGRMQVTTDGGGTSTTITPTGMTGASFDNWFAMDPTDAKHLITGGQQIFETTLGSAVRPDTWVQVFDLGTDADNAAVHHQTTVALSGAAAYAAWCGPCGVSANDPGPFRSGIATNVDGTAPPQKANAAGWHLVAAEGLDRRYITSIEIDPSDARTIYVTLAGYLSNLRPPGSYLEANTAIGTGNVFKSTDGGATFRDISGDLPRAAANTVILREGQLLVGTDVGAFISGSSEGGTWSVLGSGLPASPVVMLRTQPGNDARLFAASFGRHLWVYDLDSGTPTATRPQYHIGGALPASLLLVLGGLGIFRRRK